jgi:hypothetical protein
MERASAKPLEELSPPELEELWIAAKRKLAETGTADRHDKGEP